MWIRTGRTGWPVWTGKWILGSMKGGIWTRRGEEKKKLRWKRKESGMTVDDDKEKAPPRNRVLLKTSTVPQLVTNCPGLMDQKVHYRVHKSQVIDPVLRHLISWRQVVIYFHLSISLPSGLFPSKRSRDGRKKKEEEENTELHETNY